MPDLKHYLEGEDEPSLQALSPDKQTEFRSVIGKVLWMVPFRPDLAIATSLVSTGQATPQIRHSHAFESFVEVCFGNLELGTVFPHGHGA